MTVGGFTGENVSDPLRGQVLCYWHNFSKPGLDSQYIPGACLVLDRAVDPLRNQADAIIRELEDSVRA